MAFKQSIYKLISEKILKLKQFYKINLLLLGDYYSYTIIFKLD